MKIFFIKFSVNGNDFVFLPEIKPSQLNNQQISQICHRQLGIGADGLLLAQKNSTGFEMQIFNSDGFEADFCANGTYSLVSYFSDHFKSMNIVTKKWEYQAFLENDQWWLKFPKFEVLKFDPQKCSISGRSFLVNTGVPHLVVEKELLDKEDLTEEARILRWHEEFEKGVNVNFVKRDNHIKNKISALSYERGVENFTLSCGSGNVAITLAMMDWENKDGLWEIETQGGVQQVYYDFKSQELWYKPMVKKVADGHLYL